jgi:hypothetical protein
MKFTLLFSLCLFTAGAYAKTIARVLEHTGAAFVFYGKNQNKILQYADKILESSEIMVEDGSTLSLKEENGRILHVAGGSYIRLSKDLLEVKNGHVWVTETTKSHFGKIVSGNAIARFTGGQFIYSFDNVSGKTQVLVLSGEVKFSNAIEPNLAVEIPAGHFSFVDQELGEGLPRVATRVGLASYKQVKDMFQGVKAIEGVSLKNTFGEEAVKREIASVETENVIGNNAKKVIYIESKDSGRNVASSHQYYKEIKKPQKTVKSKAHATVRYFGFDKTVSDSVPLKKAPLVPVTVVQQKVTPSENNPVVDQQRAPASIEREALIHQINATGTFETSLQEAMESNKRHPAEVNQLINELKSYDQSFQKNY